MSNAVDKLDEGHIAYKCISKLITHYHEITEPFSLYIDVNNTNYKVSVVFDFSDERHESKFLLRIVITTDKKAFKQFKNLNHFELF